MNDLSVAREHLPAQFEPAAVKKNDAKADALIDYAKSLKDWPLLEQAVDWKIEQQREFVRWWKENVSGPGRPKNIAERGYFSTAEAEAKTNITPKQVSRWHSRLQDVPKYRSQLIGVLQMKAMADEQNHLAQGTGENEWYTPAEYVEMARDVMGSIDLDPASSVEANRTVQAEQIFTSEDDGLSQQWEGKVWLNPPYSRDLMPLFVAKLCSSFDAGDVEEAILVSHNNTDTQWFQLLARQASAICFPAKRIRFYRDETVAAPVNGQAFFYLGPTVEKFVDVYGRIGVVLCPA